MELTLFNKLCDADNQQQNNGFPDNPHIKTVTLTPFDLLLLLICTVLFITSGTGGVGIQIAATLFAAPLYAVFSYRIGNHFSFFMPLVSSVICFVVTKSVFAAMAPLLITAMSYCILNAVNTNPLRPKTSAVVGGTVSIIVYLAICLFVATEVMDLFSIKQLMSEIKSIFDTKKPEIIQMYSETYALLPQASGTAFSPEMLESYLDYVFYQFSATLPAIITIYAMLAAYVSASLLGPLSRLCHVRTLVNPATYGISLSYASVIVYFISSLGMVFAPDAAAAGFRNITYIISPGFMLCGLKQVGTICQGKGMSRFTSNVFKVLAFIASIVLGNLGTTVLIIMGMYYITKNTRAPFTE